MVTVTVQGSHTLHTKAERALLRVTVRVEGPDKDKVSRDCVFASNSAARLFRRLLRPPSDEGDNKGNAEGADTNAEVRPEVSMGKEDDEESQGAVTWWSMDSLRTHSYEDGGMDRDIQMPPPQTIYVYDTSFQAKFRDFHALSSILTGPDGALVSLPNVEVQSISWLLTKRTRGRLDAQAREGAVRAAMERATDYAKPLGLSRLRAVEVADVGLLSANSTAGFSGGPEYVAVQERQFPAAARYASHGSAALDLTPEEIDIHASVQVRFEAT